MFFFSPFAFLGFYTVDYIYSCTLHCSIASYNQTLFPPRFAPCSHSRFVPFDLRTSAQHSQPSPITSLLLRTRLATFAHPYTCDRRCLFCFGHGWQCASASTTATIDPFSGDMAQAMRRGAADMTESCVGWGWRKDDGNAGFETPLREQDGSHTTREVGYIDWAVHISLDYWFHPLSTGMFWSSHIPMTPDVELGRLGSWHRPEATPPSRTPTPGGLQLTSSCRWGLNQWLSRSLPYPGWVTETCTIPIDQDLSYKRVDDLDPFCSPIFTH